MPIAAGKLRSILPVWTLALVIGSFSPTALKQDIGAKAYGDGTAAEIGLSHRLWHWASFASSSLLYSLAVSGRRRQMLACGSVILLGFGIEFTQSAISKTGIEWTDVVDDSSAVLLFAALGQLAVLRRMLVSEPPLSMANSKR